MIIEDTKGRQMDSEKSFARGEQTRSNSPRLAKPPAIGNLFMNAENINFDVTLKREEIVSKL